MTTQNTIGTALLKSLINLREQKGQLNIQDVGAMFETMASSMQSNSVADQFLKKEIEKLASFITTAKQEMNALTPTTETNRVSGDASQHLDEVIRATEEASTTIMDAADQIQAAAAGIGGEKEQQIMDATMKLYEACNFQDLTGQRITKVIGVINMIDEQLSKLLDMFGTAPQVATQPEGTANLTLATVNEKDLLNGPQLNAKAPTQADIDALFNDVKP